MATSTSIRARLAFVALLSATTFYCIHKYRRLKRLKNLSLNPSSTSTKASRGKIFFISQTGTAKSLAQRFLEVCASNDIAFDLVDPRSYEPEDLPKETLVIFIASTWDGGKPPQNGEFLVNWLSESAEDFRVGSLLLSECKFAVFGVGSRAYGESYNAVAKELSSRMIKLGGFEMIPTGEGDVDDGELDRAFQDWCAGVIRVLKGGSAQETNGVSQNGAVENDYEYFDSTDDEDEDNDAEAGVVDLEDIAGKAPSRRNGVVKVTKGDGKKEMVTPVIRASLEKQVFLDYLNSAVLLYAVDLICTKADSPMLFQISIGFCCLSCETDLWFAFSCLSLMQHDLKFCFALYLICTRLDLGSVA